MNTPVKKEHAPINWPAAIMFTITTLVTVIAVPWYGISAGYSTAAWVAFLVLTFLTELAITAGYHRLWSHNTYKAHWSLRLFYALRSEEHTSELQSRPHIVCRLLLEKKLSLL